MIALSKSGETYTVKTLKTKLKEHYKDYIYFAELDGKPDIVSFADTNKYIISSKWYEERKESIDDEAIRIIKMAAKLIRADIRDSQYDASIYPSTDTINDVGKGKEWLPARLQCFLEEIIPSEVKQVSIGQCIVRAAMPRSSVPPLLFGLAVEMDHIFGSKWLINELFRLGYSISYNVTRCKQSVVEMETTNDILPNLVPGSFIQWVGDNIDHNINTIDGKDTFHGMGVIAVSTPTYGDVMHIRNSPSTVVKRKNIVKAKSLVMKEGIPIKTYIFPSKSALSNEVLIPYLELQYPYTLPKELNIELLWHSTGAFGNEEVNRSNWSGYMQHVTTGCPSFEITRTLSANN